MLSCLILQTKQKLIKSTFVVNPVVQYMQGPLLDALYPLEWYNNQNFTADEMGYILYENKLLGAPRLRQVGHALCW